MATTFHCDISISNGDGNKINAKSVLGITMLAAAFGTSVYIEASGKDEREARKRRTREICTMSCIVTRWFTMRTTNVVNGTINIQSID